MWSKMFFQDANWNIYIDKSSPLNEGLEKNLPRLGFSKPQTRLVFFLVDKWNIFYLQF